MNRGYYIQDGKLNGITIFRFAHCERDQYAGGVEQYLWNLNRSLLFRNCMTIIQMYQTANTDASVEFESIGLGNLIWVPSVVLNREDIDKSGGSNPWRLLKNNLYNYIFSNRYLATIAGIIMGAMLVDNSKHTNSNEHILRLFDSYDINLITLHWIADDSEEIVNLSIRRKIPHVFINHFNNRRFLLPSVKRQISKASGFAGVSNVMVPKYLKNNYVNLSDGIDTDFFMLSKASPLERSIDEYYVLLPSRIAPGKGHLDAIRSLSLLKHQGLKMRLVFAGTHEKERDLLKIKQFIKTNNLQSNITFLGKINLDKLRDFYAAADIVILPSSSEGLGRVLLEAQAMEKPVIAYDSGGIPDAIINEKTGYIVRKGDYIGLAMKMKTLMQNERLRKNMGQNARSFILKNYGQEELAIRHEDFYLKAIMNHAQHIR